MPTRKFDYKNDPEYLSLTEQIKNFDYFQDKPDAYGNKLIDYNKYAQRKKLVYRRSKIRDYYFYLHLGAWRGEAK